MADYPVERAQESFFAFRYCRLLTKTASAMDLSADGCWMLTIVAMQEDAKRYTGPVLFWNDQLMSLCGFGSEKRLRTVRSKAVNSGWLHYEKGAKSRAPRYWVLVPDQFSELPDGPCDENPNELTGNLHVQNAREKTIDVTNRTFIGHQSGVNGTPEGRTFYPYPYPNPSPDGEVSISADECWLIARAAVAARDDQNRAAFDKAKGRLPAVAAQFFESIGWAEFGQALKTPQWTVLHSQFLKRFQG